MRIHRLTRPLRRGARMMILVLAAGCADASAPSAPSAPSGGGGEQVIPVAFNLIARIPFVSPAAPTISQRPLVFGVIVNQGSTASITFSWRIRVTTGPILTNLETVASTTVLTGRATLAAGDSLVIPLRKSGLGPFLAGTRVVWLEADPGHELIEDNTTDNVATRTVRTSSPPLPATRNVTFFATTESGVPAPGIQVYVMDGFSLIQGTTDASGRKTVAVRSLTPVAYFRDPVAARYQPAVIRPTLMDGIPFHVMMKRVPTSGAPSATALFDFMDGLAHAFGYADQSVMYAAMRAGTLVAQPVHFGAAPVFGFFPVSRIDSGAQVILLGGSLTDPLTRFAAPSSALGCRVVLRPPFEYCIVPSL